MLELSPIYRFIVAHLIPGVLAIYPLSEICNNIKYIIGLILSKDGTIWQFFILIILSLMLGLLIDGIRLVSISFLVEKIQIWVFKQKSSSKKVKCIDDLEFLEKVYSMHYAWVQFYSNIAIVVLIIIFVMNFSLLEYVVLISLVVVFIFASSRSLTKCEKLLCSKFDED